MSKISNNFATPLYQQLYDEILMKIKSGEYKIGDKIPSEANLSKIYGISRITVRNGIQKLCDDNVLVKKHGKGTYVSMPVYVESLSAEGSFTKSCLQMNKTPSTEIIQKGLKKIDDQVHKHLGLEKNEKIIYVFRLRFIDKIPTIYEKDYFNKDFDFILKENLENTPLLDVIKSNLGYKAKTFENIIDIKYSNKEESDYLKCKVGTPLLCVKQTVLGENGEIIYFNEQLINSDIYKYTVRSTN